MLVYINMLLLVEQKKPKYLTFYILKKKHHEVKDEIMSLIWDLLGREIKVDEKNEREKDMLLEGNKTKG